MSRPGEEERKIKRKDFLKVSGLIGAASLITACGTSDQLSASPLPASTSTSSPASTPTATIAETQTPELTLRIAHITDMHIQPEGNGRELFSRALHNVQSLDPPVDIIINTGDCIMDSLGADKTTALAEWDTFQSVLPADFPLPVYHAIGNHDVWGWGLSAEEQARLQHDPVFGKGLALQRLGLTNRYYSFELGGWHFIVLDSNHPRENQSEHPYTGKLDDEQYDWLAGELAATSPTTPICIVSHIPIFGACSLLDSDVVNANWVMPGAWQHIDAARLIALFWEHRNVQLCLSGHTHQIEDLRYHGVKYLTDGAICANWWSGPYHDFPYAFVVVNLYKDGSSDSEVIAY